MLATSKEETGDVDARESRDPAGRAARIELEATRTELVTALPPPEEKRVFVRAMFDRIAPRYDLMNRLISLGMDRSWRSDVVEAAGIGPGSLVVDVACGTGDLAQLAVARGARVVAVDFALGMLCAGRSRTRGAWRVQADAALLPLPDACADVVTCGFALRNFVNLDAVFRECARVLVAGGRVGFVEFDQPRPGLLRWGHELHLRRIVPRIGAWLSDGPAYRYLPASMHYLPSEPQLTSDLKRAGFTRVDKTSRMLGAVQLLTAERV